VEGTITTLYKKMVLFEKISNDLNLVVLSPKNTIVAFEGNTSVSFEFKKGKSK